jgi:dihydrofolate synthase/folylpolyglutamate synthase
LKVSHKPSAKIFWDYSIVNEHRINMAGAHQISNLATALAAVDALKDMGWKLNLDAIYKGLSDASWPCRMWSVPTLSNVIFDGAHNTNGAEVLASHISAFNIRPHLFFSAMNDKDLQGMAEMLARVKPLSVTLVQGNDTRCSTPESMQSAWSGAGHTELPVTTIKELSTKLQTNISDICIVTGSLYFLGHLMKELKISV